MMSMHLPPDFGGGGEQMMRLGVALQKKGADVLLFSGTADPKNAGYSESPVPTWRIYTPGTYKVRNFWFLVKTMWFLLKRGGEFDVLHATSIYWAALLAIVQFKMRGAKTVVQFSLKAVDDPISVRKSSLGGLKYAILKMIDRYSSMSGELVEELRRELPDFSDRVVLIHNGVDTDEFHPVGQAEKVALREKLGLPRDAVLFCFCGVVNRRKGVDVLLRAWGKMKQREGAAVVIVGPVNMDGLRAGFSAETISAMLSTPEYVAELTAIMDEVGEKEKIIFTGATNRVPDWLAASDVFVFPSRREGQPNAPGEAMACGLPIVASDFPGCGDMVSPGENGFLFELENADEMAERMDTLLADEELRKKMGAVSLKAIRETFSMHAVATKYFEMYKEIIGEKKP